MIHNYHFIKVRENIKRTNDVISIIADKPKDFYYHPGQFIMVWLPEINEKPFSISSVCDEAIEITIKILGDWTQKAGELSKGDSIGIRGPFGNGFNLVTIKDSLIIAGGVGIACLSHLALTNPGLPMLYGSKSKDDIIFPDRFSDSNCIYATDDGSFGKAGYITDIFIDYLNTEKVRTVYACGPEMMLYKLLEICSEYEIRYFASIERYMKCGIGVCGQCSIDDRIICIDGPVFDGETLMELKEFGNKRYNKAGQVEII